MNEEEIVDEVRRQLEKIRSFNHDDLWERMNVKFKTTVHYSVDDDSGKISLRYFVHEE